MLVIIYSIIFWPYQTLFWQSGSVQWCGPDGSVVLIRAVRSGLDRVVLELLRAGVPVNNTDHTGITLLSQFPNSIINQNVG